MCPVQDEAQELTKQQPSKHNDSSHAAESSSGQDESSAESALAWLATHCDVAVVTLGERGCVVRERGSDDVIREPAAAGVKVVDATGAYTACLSPLKSVLKGGAYSHAHTEIKVHMHVVAVQSCALLCCPMLCPVLCYGVLFCTFPLCADSANNMPTSQQYYATCVYACLHFEGP